MNGWIEALLTLAVLGGWAFVSSVAADATERPTASQRAVVLQAHAGPPCPDAPSRRVLTLAANRAGAAAAEGCAVR